MDALETGLEWLSHKIIGNNLIQEFATGNMFITANNNIRNVKGCVFPPSAPQLPVNGYYVHYILRDYYRQDGKVKHRTIANLSSCSSAEIQAIQIVQESARRWQDINATMPKGLEELKTLCTTELRIQASRSVIISCSRGHRYKGL